MSCQQVSRLITTTASSSVSSVTPEDPYVFTETVPATPPILFNTQKSRSKHTETQFTTATATKSAHIQKLPLAPLNGNGAKSLQNSLAGIAVNATIAAATNFKNVTQSQKQQQLQQNVKFSTAATATNTNVCIVRNSQQQKQQHHNKYKQLQQKQQSPPLLLQHTPSLWQTPLLLDTAVAAATATVVESPLTSPASLPTSTDTLKTPTVMSTIMPVASTIATTVAPSVCPTSLVTSSLPPSKFHHTTLAQHLQKVQCIKKPKKPTSSNIANSSQGSISNSGTVSPPLHSHQHDVEVKLVSEATSPSAPPPLQTFKAPQHSDTDLNEIPVNVIFRKPQTTSEITRTLLGEAASVEENENETLKKPATQTAVITSPATVVNSLKNVKIITPSLTAASPPSSISSLPEAIHRRTLSKSPPSLTSHNNLIPAPNVLRDIVFVQPITKRDSMNLVPSAAAATTTTMAPQAATTSKHITSSMAMLNHNNDSVSFNSSIPAQKSQNTTASPNKDAQLEKSLQTGTPHGIVSTPPSSKPAALHKSGYKRKGGNSTAIAKLNNSGYSSFTLKKNRKSAPVFSLSDSCIIPNIGGFCSSTAVAVVKMSAAEVDADTTLLASENVLPYCVQQHWLSVYEKAKARSSSGTCVSVLEQNIGREDRIAQHKIMLRRQALQLLTTRSLQKLPLQAARRRLLCVDRLLRKYENHNEEDPSAKKCVIFPCTNRALEMASHCQQHISNNAAQHIFLACTAKFADNTQCRIPVFDITHDLPLCTEHARKRDAYNRNVNEQQQQRPRKMSASTVVLQSLNDLQRQQQQPPQQQPQYPKQQVPHVQVYYHNNNINTNKKANIAKATQPRKRKSNNNNSSSNTVGRPQKRSKKIVTPTATAATNTTTTTLATSPALLSAVFQRKSSTTSLESIASNSQSSSSQTHSSHHTTTQQQYASNSSLAPPALAPLSNGSGSGGGNNVGNACAGASHRMLNFGASAANGAAAMLPSDVSDLKEINQFVAQFAMVANNNNNNNNYNYINNNMNFINTNSNSNFTSSGLGGVGGGSSSSLPSTDDLLTQDMLSICENSSAYASSEDTGLGGISETELMAGAQDADDIPLGDTRLLEEHDLVNVLSALPMDAFNELFTAVHQEEREEVERALELADKHLKTLQQTISSESDFLGDFFDGHDDILADTADMCSKMDIVSSVMHSPDTSGIDTSTLFLDSGSNSGGGSAGAGGGTTTTSNCPTVADIRGLVQT